MKWITLCAFPFYLKCCQEFAWACWYITQQMTFYSAQLNQTQSVDWVRQSNQSNSVHQIMFDWVQLNTIQWISFDRVWRLNSIERKPVDCFRLCSVNKFIWIKVMLCGMKNLICMKRMLYLSNLRWLNIVFDILILFIFFSKTLDPLVAKKW